MHLSIHSDFSTLFVALRNEILNRMNLQPQDSAECETPTVTVTGMKKHVGLFNSGAH